MKKIILFFGMFMFSSCGDDLTKFYIKCLPLKAPYQINWYVHSLFGGFSIDHLELYNQETKQCNAIASCGSIHDIYTWGDSLVILIGNQYYDAKAGAMMEFKDTCDGIQKKVLEKLNYAIVAKYGSGGAGAMTRLSKIQAIRQDTCFTMHSINTDE